MVHVAPTAFGSDGLLGGGERYPVELARSLAGRVTCRLVTFGPRPQRYREESGLEVVVLQRRLLLKGHPAHPLALGLAPATRDFDIVHTHHMRSAPSRIAALAARARRQRVAVTDHGLGGGGWMGLLPRLFDLFLTVSRYSADVLGAPSGRTRVIYGGADPTRFGEGEGKRDGVLFVGRLTPHKGIEHLIRALPEGASLTVVGTAGHDPRDPERGYLDFLRRTASGRDVRFVGAVGEEELPELYRSAAVFVLPSVHHTCYGRHVAISELLGLSVVEAMASATPVVCSRIGGLPEIVRDRETGMLVDPGDVAGLRGCLEELLGDPERARAMGRNGRHHVEAELTWERCGDKCVEAYAELLSTGAA